MTSRHMFKHSDQGSKRVSKQRKQAYTKLSKPTGSYKQAKKVSSNVAYQTSKVTSSYVTANGHKSSKTSEEAYI